MGLRKAYLNVGYVTCLQLGLLRIIQAICAGECSIALACELGGYVCSKHTVCPLKFIYKFVDTNSGCMADCQLSQERLIVRPVLAATNLGRSGRRSSTVEQKKLGQR